jgi:hypothetical protein
MDKVFFVLKNTFLAVYDEFELSTSTNTYRNPLGLVQRWAMLSWRKLYYYLSLFLNRSLQCVSCKWRSRE